MVSSSMQTTTHLATKRAGLFFVVLTLLLLLIALVSPKTALANPTQLTREQIAIIFMLLRDSDLSEESINSDTNTAEAYYASDVKTQVVEAICLSCHVNNGFAGSTDLIFAHTRTHARTRTHTHRDTRVKRVCRGI